MILSAFGQGVHHSANIKDIAFIKNKLSKSEQKAFLEQLVLSLGKGEQEEIILAKNGIKEECELNIPQITICFYAKSVQQEPMNSL